MNTSDQIAMWALIVSLIGALASSAISIFSVRQAFLSRLAAQDSAVIARDALDRPDRPEFETSIQGIGAEHGQLQIYLRKVRGRKDLSIGGRYRLRYSYESDEPDRTFMATSEDGVTHLTALSDDERVADLREMNLMSGNFYSFSVGLGGKRLREAQIRLDVDARVKDIDGRVVQEWSAIPCIASWTSLDLFRLGDR